ncbi:hypothetical protein GCM10009827_019130 [Dactylosporangium maewongense]|uniref:Helicase/UvrB N-terminal domain-containing protein n=1 Tax=Dactylosporangium maewongense TaxID=634393 RepID=A0ABN1ZWW5_9ACTN
MLPSLARRDDVAELTNGYGHVIVDECHHLAAAAYDHSVKSIAAQFWLGLTATPARRDGLGELVLCNSDPSGTRSRMTRPATIKAHCWTPGRPTRDHGGCCTCARPPSSSAPVTPSRPLRSPKRTAPSPSTRHATPNSSPM